MNITNEKVTDYIVSFYQPWNDTMGKLREQSEADQIPLILKETEMLFRTLLPLRPAHRVLEIGTAYGYLPYFLHTSFRRAILPRWSFRIPIIKWRWIIYGSRG